MALSTVHQHSPEDRFFRIDELENRAAQLNSLLTLLYGHGSKSFNSLHETDQDNILWLASDLASEINEIVNKG